VTEPAGRTPRATAYLRDIRDSGKAIAAYLRGATEEEFRRNPMRQDAVIRRLEIIGEAAGRIMNVDRHFLEHFPSLPLREAYDMRNFVSHGYDAVDLAIVWDTASKDVPALTEAVEAVLAVWHENNR
jgi:uncharacterized protein with HEPN domain